MTATARTATARPTRSLLARATRNVTAVLLTMLAVLGISASPAAAASGSLYAYGGSATYNDSSTLTGWRVTGSVTDTLADGVCATVWLRGRNWVIGYGSWERAGTACGRGTRVYYDSRFSLYSDAVYVQLCAQTCTAVTRAH